MTSAVTSSGLFFFCLQLWNAPSGVTGDGTQHISQAAWCSSRRANRTSCVMEFPFQGPSRKMRSIVILWDIWDSRPSSSSSCFSPLPSPLGSSSSIPRVVSSPPHHVTSAPRGVSDTHLSFSRLSDVWMRFASLCGLMGTEKDTVRERTPPVIRWINTRKSSQFVKAVILMTYCWALVFN